MKPETKIDEERQQGLLDMKVKNNDTPNLVEKEIVKQENNCTIRYILKMHFYKALYPPTHTQTHTQYVHHLGQTSLTGGWGLSTAIYVF